MRKLLAFLSFFLCLVDPVSSQPRLPLEVHSAFSYSQSDKLSEFRRLATSEGKKVILDLFNSSCIVCFRMLPKVNALQQKYKNKLQVIMVGDEDDQIRKVYSKFQQNLQLKLPVVYDSALFNRYRIEFVPCQIWLDEHGVIQAVAGPDELNESNIDLFLADKPIVMSSSPEKITFNQDKLLLTDGNAGADTKFLFRSLLTLYHSSLPHYSPLSLVLEKPGNFFQTLGANMTELYRYAYIGSGSWTFGDSLYGKVYPKLVFTDKSAPDSPDSARRYCYSFKQPDSLHDQGILERALRNDLATYFGYSVTVSIQKMPCWKLVVLPGFKEKLRTRHSQRYAMISYAEVTLRNGSLSSLMQMLDYYGTHDYPYIDATGIDFNVDISVEGILTEPAAFREALRKVGLDVVPGEQEMQVLLLSKEKKPIQ